MSVHHDPPHAPEFESYRDELFSRMSHVEKSWRDRQAFLEASGYMLRPRYRPGWVPSWRGKGGAILPTFCEDAIALPFRDNLIDATRISDGALVYIKRVKTGDQESRIAIMLSSEALRADPRNYSVPIIDVLQDPDNANIGYIVMPFLRLFNDPPFEQVNEVVDFVDQLLVGLTFLHEQGVAHRDCTNKNLMMDANSMFPDGFHPVKKSFLSDAQTVAPRLPRSSAAVKYYYVDFGISSYFPPGSPQKFVRGTDGRDKEVPELSDTVSYDPFKVDIFIIGNLFRHEFHEKFSNVDFLAPLITAMTQTDPERRPDAEGALQLWRSQCSRVSALHGQWRLIGRDEPSMATLWFNVSAVYDAFTSRVKNILLGLMRW